MQKRGLTAAGTQRWYYHLCRSSAVKKRSDTQVRHHRMLFTRWLTGNRSLSEIADEYGVSRRTLIRWFKPLWQHFQQPIVLSRTSCSIYILDGVYLSGRENAALICKTMDAQISWQFAERETLVNWLNFLTKLPVPDAAVMDGQKELLAATQCLWAQTKIQRCIVHIGRRARIKLTRQPKTDASKELLKLIQRLFTVHTKKQRGHWLCVYRCWERRHSTFLKEHSYGEPLTEKNAHGGTHTAIFVLRAHSFVMHYHTFLPSSTTRMCHEQRTMLKMK